MLQRILARLMLVEWSFGGEESTKKGPDEITLDRNELSRVELGKEGLRGEEHGGVEHVRVEIGGVELRKGESAQC